MPTPPASRMTAAAVDALLDAHYGAEQAGDTEATLATLTEDVEHDIVGLSDLRGHEAVRAFYDGLFGELDHESFTRMRRYYGPDFVVDESLVRARAIGSPFGLEGRGRNISFRLLHVFELRDGRISRENAWLDVLDIQRQLG